MNDKIYMKQVVVAEGKWPENYYEISDPEARKALLDTQLASPESTELDAHRATLFARRYEVKKKLYADAYLRTLFSLQMLAIDSPGVFKGKKAKTVQEELAFFCADEVAVDEAAREAAYAEMVHTVRVYIDSCKTDKQYNSLVLGFGQMKKDAFLTRLITDFRQFSNLSRKFPLDEHAVANLETVKKAIGDAMIAEFPNDRIDLNFLK